MPEVMQQAPQSFLRSDMCVPFDDGFISRETGPALSCLREISIFSGLSDDEITAFESVAHSRLYKKGKMLYVEGEPASYFYVILSGWVKLFHTMPEGDEVIMDMLTKGSLLGESAIFEKDRHTGSAQVIEDVQLFSIPLRTLKEQIVVNKNLAFSMLLAMSRHHRQHCSERALNAMQSAPQRVGYFLLKLCPKNQDQGIIFRLPYNKTLIAETLGMKSETFSRSLNILRNKIGLRIKGSNVEIDSTERLAKFVYGSFSSKVMFIHQSF
ncbi:MAG: Crp/Fnr family transcriptional regulator [Alphaproteobacteria bacterium]|nr:Crp/Fnr family transcriptional regulator [Alphaproteobacteria bacterium]